jgi:hypothetical protein
MNRECRGGRPLSQLMCGIAQKCRQVYGTTNGGKREWLESADRFMGQPPMEGRGKRERGGMVGKVFKNPDGNQKEKRKRGGNGKSSH